MQPWGGALPHASSGAGAPVPGNPWQDALDSLARAGVISLPASAPPGSHVDAQHPQPQPQPLPQPFSAQDALESLARAGVLVLPSSASEHGQVREHGPAPTVQPAGALALQPQPQLQQHVMQAAAPYGAPQQPSAGYNLALAAAQQWLAPPPAHAHPGAPQYAEHLWRPPLQPQQAQAQQGHPPAQAAPSGYPGQAFPPQTQAAAAQQPAFSQAPQYGTAVPHQAAAQRRAPAPQPRASRPPGSGSGGGQPQQHQGPGPGAPPRARAAEGADPVPRPRQGLLSVGGGAPSAAMAFMNALPAARARPAPKQPPAAGAGAAVGAGAAAGGGAGPKADGVAKPKRGDAGGAAGPFARRKPLPAGAGDGLKQKRRTSSMTVGQMVAHGLLREGDLLRYIKARPRPPRVPRAMRCRAPALQSRPSAGLGHRVLIVALGAAPACRLRRVHLRSTHRHSPRAGASRLLVGICVYQRPHGGLLVAWCAGNRPPPSGASPCTPVIPCHSGLLGLMCSVRLLPRGHKRLHGRAGHRARRRRAAAGGGPGARGRHPDARPRRAAEPDRVRGRVGQQGAPAQRVHLCVGQPEPAGAAAHAPTLTLTLHAARACRRGSAQAPARRD